MQYAIITAVTFILILGLLVIIHELGHFLTARLFKVRVEEFGIGFPPRVYPRRARVAQLRAEGRTVYSLNALPLGGFVRLAGENGVTAADAGAGAQRDGSRSLSGSVAGSDDPGAFAGKPAWQRAIILVAGAFNNMVLAMILVFFIFVGIGTPHVGIAVVGVAEHSPAYAAGLRAGDLIQKVDGKVPQDQTEVKDLVAAHQGQPVTMQVLRDGEPYHLRLVPRSSYACDQGPIGVMTDAVNERYVPTDPGRAASAALSVPGTVVGDIASLIGQIGTPQPTCAFASTYITYNGQLTSALGVGNAPGAVQADPCLTTDGSGGGIAGPIGIIRQVGCEVNSVPTQGWLPLLTLVVELSATLAVMNLLPIPALDGGRLLFVLISVVARRRIRPEVEGMAHALGMAALLTVMLVVSWHDVMNLLASRPAF